jgi:GNAT superfamily N-acetyltransferase
MAVVRRATVDDIDVLVEARMAFVTEFADVDDADSERASLIEYLGRSLESEAFLVWVVEEEGRVTATAGMVVYERMMRSRGAGVGCEGYILNVYTYPEFRRRGQGRLAMQALMDCARERRIRLTLLSTDDGRSLYEQLGFTHDDRTYRWWP